MKPMVPPKAIGKPMADAVPIAFLIDTLHHTKNGTVSAPPPTATSEDAVPIKVATPICPLRPGNTRPGLGLYSKNI
jgi:hypothetical protein